MNLLFEYYVIKFYTGFGILSNLMAIYETFFYAKISIILKIKVDEK